MASYIVATTKPWSLSEYARFTAGRPGEWHLVETPEALSVESIGQIRPRYIFFPHWSWKVPPEIFESAECILFHMTDLPYGRGGSPLQNLIVRGHKETKVSAVRMVGALDAGPIYLKRALSLEGSAEEIFVRLSQIVFGMIEEIVATGPAAVPQTGTPVLFARRTPQQSCLPATDSLDELYDHIRMLDAETYPTAFLDFGRWRLEFRQAVLENGRMTAQVVFHPRPEKEGERE